MQGAFHGKTHGALSMTTAAGFQRGFLLGIPKENVIYVPYGDINAIEAAIRTETKDGKNSIIAVIVEPIRGSACEVPPVGYLTNIAKLCRDNDILSIFDEVKVGMGRTGKFCAFQHEDVVPDIVTLAKTLGGWRTRDWRDGHLPGAVRSRLWQQAGLYAAYFGFWQVWAEPRGRHRNPERAAGRKPDRECRRNGCLSEQGIQRAEKEISRRTSWQRRQAWGCFRPFA